MKQFTAGSNTDVVRPLSFLSGLRRVMALASRCTHQAICRPRQSWAIFGCWLLLASMMTNNAVAQAPRSSGLSSPDSSPGITSTGSKSTNDGSTATKKRAGDIRQASSVDGFEDPRPKSPFELDDPLTAVEVEGNTTIRKSEIAKHIHTRAGRPVTQKQIKDDVDALVRTRWFASVEPTIRESDDGNGKILVFRVIEKPIVRRVEYKGLKKLKQKTFDNLTQLKPGSPFDVASNRECARRIEEHYHDKGFPFATVDLEKGNERDDREVVFLIHEGPKVHVTAVVFHGNKEFISGILKTKTRTKTQILGLFGGKYDPSTIRDDIEGIKQYYHSLGYFDVEIKERQEFSNDKSKCQIHYTLEEGIRYKIRDIEIVGNEVLSEEELREMMKVKGNIPYNARDINKDVDTIKTKYGEQGRLFSEVNAIPRWTEEEGIVDIVYKINEDKVYRVRNINVHMMGDHPHTRTNLVRNISPVQPGDLADPKQIHLMKRRLEGSQNFDTGGPNGGPGGGIRVETNIVKNNNWITQPEYQSARSQSADDSLGAYSKRRTNRTDEVADEVSHQSAKPYRQYGMFGWIGSSASRQESSNPFVSVTSHFDEVAPPITLASDMPKPKVDDGLSPITPIFRAQSKEPLQPPANFGFDNSPQGDPFGRALRNPDPDDVPEFVDLDTYLSEARTGRLMFGVGVNSDAGLVGNIVLSEQNFDITRPPQSMEDIWNGRAFRGGGQKFKIEAMPGTQVSRYLIDWTDPYIFDSPYSLSTSGFYFTRYYRNWYENRIGGRIRLGRQLTRRWSSSLALRLEDVDIYNPTVPSPQILTNALGYSLLSTLRGSIIHDTRDAAFNSGQGHYFELSYEQAFGQFSYPRVEVEARQYFTTYQRVDGQGKHTISIRGQAGWSGSDTPIYERFFAGGFQTFRGFAFRGVSPVDTGVYTGGNFMALGSAEYQMPVTANEMIKVVGFTDFGTVNDTASLENFRVSVGGGFRVSVPMMGPVPIAIDFAIPILQQTTDIKQVISFYVGASR